MIASVNQCKTIDKKTLMVNNQTVKRIPGEFCYLTCRNIIFEV